MQAFIGLGSNLSQPKQQIRSAIAAIAQLSQTRLVASSSLYLSPPMGPSDQPDYVNAVVEIDTTLAPLELLDHLQAIEQSHGRVRTRHWGARTLDCDILLLGVQQMRDARLVVPHPGISQRSFVLVPLAEIAPDVFIPGVGRVADLVSHCPMNGLTLLEAVTA